mgnify:CR=1 FL=1
MKGVQEKLEDFSVVGVKPGFMTHDQEGPDSAFETLNQNSFEGKWKIFYFYPKDTLRILDALQTDELCACNRPLGGDTL